MSWFGAPTLYALDEHGLHVQPWSDGELNAPREGSDFADWPGVPACLELTRPEFPDRIVLLDVDTLRVTRIDRAELAGKRRCRYDAAEMRGHLEELIEQRRRHRLRLPGRELERAMRRLASSGVRSTWLPARRRAPVPPDERAPVERPPARPVRPRPAPVALRRGRAAPAGLDGVGRTLFYRPELAALLK